jgi:hypothetical protein
LIRLRPIRQNQRSRNEPNRRIRIIRISLAAHFLSKQNNRGFRIDGFSQHLFR